MTSSSDEIPKYHRLLRRQLDRHAWGASNVPPEMQNLVNAVNDAYRHSDDDRHLMERSLELSSKELLQANSELRALAAALQHSNAELEQFAYVASHDLQEPLRTVSSYMQLLQRRYGDQLDETASEFIGYAVEGAARMRQLIHDLLAYARVTSRANPPEPTAVGTVLAQVWSGLAGAVAESNAELSYVALPTVLCDPRQLHQLLQNLLSNAIKFRSDDPPRIRVSATQKGEAWQFSIADNGIGMESKHAEKIFIIFQRLHSRSQYPGTGIGLALCKKIVERHDGTIWVESTLGEGTTFHFTLPIALSTLGDDT